MFRVLLPIDTNNTRAVAAARAVTDLPGPSSEYDVHILNVFESFEVTDEGGDVRSEELYEETRFPESVHAAEDVLTAAGLQVDKRREHGEPVEMILTVANDISPDLIAIGGRKRTPTGKAIFGSVTQSIIRESAYPVLTVTDD